MNSDMDKTLNICIDRWKRHLLDLTGRNRALYYRPARTTLTLHASPDKLWDILMEQGAITLDKKLLIPPTDDPEEEARMEEDVARRIKGVSGIARVYLDEQGVHVTHAAFGWLTWVDDSRPPTSRDKTVTLRNGRKAKLVRSPLLFVPITIERSRNRARATFERNAPVESNITLEYALSQQFGVEVKLDPDADLDPDIVISAWKEATKGRQHWKVEPGNDVIVDTFSFKKIAILREMERSKGKIGRQPVLKALCGDDADLLEAPSVPSYDSLDEMVASDRLSLVVPADASQKKALIAAKRGVNLVIQGPPGTGKSQTITNLVSTLVADGKRVLFVAEKRQARDVVVRNLAEAGLSEITLHITEEVLGRRGSSGAKSDIADQLGEILKQGPGSYDLPGDPQREYAQITSELNDYARKLHSPLGPSADSTPFRLLSDWSRYQHEYDRNLDTDLDLPSIRQIDDSWKQQALEFANRVDDLGESTLSKANNAWLDCDLEAWDPRVEPELRRALTVLANGVEPIHRIAAVHNSHVELAAGEWTFTEAKRLHEMLVAVADHHDAKRRRVGFLKPRFWRTKKEFQEFVERGGESVESARSSANELQRHLSDVLEARASLANAFPTVESSQSIKELEIFASELLDSISSAQETISVKTRCEAAHRLKLDQILLGLVRTRRPGQSVAALLEMILAKHWAEEAIASDPCFDIEDRAHARLIARLRESDAADALASRASALNATAPHRPGNADVAPRGSELGVLRSQINARRRRSLRWLFTHAANTIQQIKPCIVASPLAVAQFLHSDSYGFDVVVFDEASQIPTADAVVAVSKAKQVVVVGDSQQMPPTSFFDRGIPEEDDSEEITYESILSESEALLPSRPLLWHYRSLDERLIAFSNQSFYKGDLLTFPSAWNEHPDMGVKFCYLPDAVYGRGGSRANPEEAQKVVALLTDELKTNPEYEVGVTAMSVAQSLEIQERIEAAATNTSVVQKWLDEGGRARNLETIQGDEFDVSILSFGYGKDAAGNVQLNFGPLSREDGYKRLNVAVTRARRKTIVVSSIRAADIPAGRVGSGGRIVRQYLDYAERGPVSLSEDLRVNAFDIYQSPFEEEVTREIRALGWSVDTQVGVGKYRIDIGVRDPNHQGRYLAGIECDGATYHSAETARDRDIGRQEVLERLGWHIYRIWSPDWFRDRRRVLHALDDYLSGLASNGSKGGPTAKRAKPAKKTQTDRAKLVFRSSEKSLPPGLVEYRAGSSQRFPADGDDAAWRRWLIDKIKIEGPWGAKELVRAINRNRAYSSRYIHDILRETVADKGLIERDSRLWHPDTNPRLVPVKVNRGDLRRDFSMYSDEELLRALELACAGVGSISGKELPVATARLLGFARTSQAIRERLELLLEKAVAEGYLIDEGNRFRTGSLSYDRSVSSDGRPTASLRGEAAPKDATEQATDRTQSKRTTDESELTPSRSLFLRALEIQAPLRVKYRSSGGRLTTRTIDVYGVGPNHIDAFDHLRREQRTFRIDRVLSANWAESESFVASKRYSPSSWVRQG